MNVKLQTCIIACVITAVISIVFVCGAAYLLFNNADKELRKQLDGAIENNKQLAEKLNIQRRTNDELKQEIAESRKLLDRLIDSNRSDVESIERAKDIIDEIRNGIKQGLNEK